MPIVHLWQRRKHPKGGARCVLWAAKHALLALLALFVYTIGALFALFAVFVSTIEALFALFDALFALIAWKIKLRDEFDLP